MEEGWSLSFRVGGIRYFDLFWFNKGTKKGGELGPNCKRTTKTQKNKDSVKELGDREEEFKREKQRGLWEMFPAFSRNNLNPKP